MLPQNQIPAPSKPSSSLDSLLYSSAPQTQGGDAGGLELATSRPNPDNEKGERDAGMTEKTAETLETLKIHADLKTEAGSQFGDTEDPSLSLPGDHDMVALPIHSHLKLGGQGSVEDRRRELARAMAEHVVQAALLAGSRNNISVMVILLPGCGL